MKKQEILFAISLILILVTVSVVIIFSRKDSTSINSEAGKKESEKLSETKVSNTQEIPTTNQLVRKSAVAGEFYPSDPKILKEKLQGYLDEAQKIDIKGKLRVLIVPHAGLEFAGKTAMAGYKQIEGQHYSKVIVLGVNHQGTKKFAAVYPGGQWETPLGNVEIDHDLASRIVNGEDIIYNTEEHASDHSIEMEVVYLKYVLKDFKLVPIMLSNPSNDTVEALANKIAAVFDDETLLVVSSDLSHYPDYDGALDADTRTINAILSGNKKRFEQATSENYARRIPNLVTSACGFHPIRVGLRVAELLDLGRLTKIDYTNSGDITGQKDKVVGYGAIGGWSEKLPSLALDDAARQEALALARKTLESYYKNGTRMLYEPQNEVLNKPIGAFVTLTKNGELRGCIGNFDPDKPFYRVVQEMAIRAAVDDKRFEPVSEDELSQLDIEVSALSPLTRISDYHNIVLGKNGVKIVLGNKSGTFLPEVATDTKWDLETFLQNLCTQKMGLSAECYKDPKAEIFTYTTDAFYEN
jgi:hypothetical protein